MIEDGCPGAAGTPLAGAYSVHVSSNCAPAGVIAGRVGTLPAGSAERGFAAESRPGADPTKAVTGTLGEV